MNSYNSFCVLVMKQVVKQAMFKNTVQNLNKTYSQLSYLICHIVLQSFLYQNWSSTTQY